METYLYDFFRQYGPVEQALIGTLFTWFVTAAGAAVVLFTRRHNQKLLDGMLGLSAGVMIAASFWSLLAPVGLFKPLELPRVSLHFTAVQLTVGGLAVATAWALRTRRTWWSSSRPFRASIRERRIDDPRSQPKKTEMLLNTPECHADEWEGKMK